MVIKRRLKQKEIHIPTAHDAGAELLATGLMLILQRNQKLYKKNLNGDKRRTIVASFDPSAIRILENVYWSKIYKMTKRQAVHQLPHHKTSKWKEKIYKHWATAI